MTARIPPAQFAYRRAPDQDRAAGNAAHHRIVIVGAGPVGLTLALDLARRGVRSVLLDDADRIGEGSRAICFAKRTLEIFDRLGVAAPMLEKGVVWQKGRVFQGADEIYAFDLLPEPGHKMPAFINLQQYYVERFLVDAALAQPHLIDLRWRNKVVGVVQGGPMAPLTDDSNDLPPSPLMSEARLRHIVPEARLRHDARDGGDHGRSGAWAPPISDPSPAPWCSHAFGVRGEGRHTTETAVQDRRSSTSDRESGSRQVTIEIETPDGPYRITADWVVACDGARSPVRGMLGLDFHGEVFEDQFLIADVKMAAPFPTERWFWFDPPFHSGRSALLHKQPDDIWRIDLQLSPDADASIEREPAKVRERITRMIGHDRFSLEWVSIYRFQCRRLQRFVHGPVIFAGDAAHQVSPFGARGANSGVQDADNLGWKLAAVVSGVASPGLIDSYDTERGEAADENILNSTRATDFIAPRSAAEVRFRDAALALSRHAEFAKRFVNSGRLSTPTSYGMPAARPGGGVAPGAPLPDAPLTTRDGRRVWLTDVLGPDLTAVGFGGAAAELNHPLVTVVTIGGDYDDRDGLAAARLTGGRPGVVLVRPDGHVAAVFEHLTQDQLSTAVDMVFVKPGKLGDKHGDVRDTGQGHA